MPGSMITMPSIRCSMGDWIYYVTSISYKNIKEYVTADISELHDSEVLSNMLQRSISNNYLDIKEYLLHQEERLFNSLVLAVYNGAPKWVDSKMNYNGKDYFDIGLLELSGGETIFPIDGQHRVKGILEALIEKSDDEMFANEQVPVILIAHSTEDKERSRRLFSTLNRRAKAVNIRDIIALDEDDAAAIITRNLIESHILFEGNRILDMKSKQLPNTNKIAFISTIALYDCNKQLLKYFRKLDKPKKFANYIKYRPKNKELKNFDNFAKLFWNKLYEKNITVNKYILEHTTDNIIPEFRNPETGGDLIFRPIGILPFIISILEIKKRNKKLNVNDILESMNEIDFNLLQKPWNKVLWDNFNKKMLRAHDKLVVKLFLFLFQKQTNKTILSQLEIDEMCVLYIERISEDISHEEALEQINSNLTSD